MLLSPYFVNDNMRMIPKPHYKLNLSQAINNSSMNKDICLRFSTENFAQKELPHERTRPSWQKSTACRTAAPNSGMGFAAWGFASTGAKRLVSPRPVKELQVITFGSFRGYTAERYRNKSGICTIKY